MIRLRVDAKNGEEAIQEAVYRLNIMMLEE